MKLDCDIAKDLYILYQENELSPKVREAVEEHLANCHECKLTYETGKGFPDVNQEIEEIAPSEKLDDKIRLKLKLKRLKIVLLFLTSFFLLYGYFTYIDNRKSMLYEISSTERTLNTIRFIVLDIKESKNGLNLLNNQLEDLNEQYTRIRRHLTFFEKRKLENSTHSLNTQFKTTKLLELLYKKSQAGAWNEKDQVVYDRLNQYIKDYMKTLTDERLKLNGLYSTFNLKSRFEPINIEKIASIQYSINLLSKTYYEYQKLPEEIDILSKDEMIERIKFIFNTPTAEIKLADYISDETAKTLGQYPFELIVRENNNKEANLVITGDIDAYTGQVQDFHSSSIKTEGDTIPKSIALDSLKQFLHKEFAEIQFDIKDLGLNYHFSSNVDQKLYTYRVSPIINGYSLDTSYLFRIDSRTGMLAMMMFEQGNPPYTNRKLTNISPVEIKVDKEKAADIFQDEQGKRLNYGYIDTIYIKSMVTGNYELVYKYEIKNNQEKSPITRYVNVKTGKEDFPY